MTEHPRYLYLHDEDGMETTWCDQRLDDSDSIYIRSDVVEGLLKIAQMINLDTAKAFHLAMDRFEREL